MYVSYPMRVGDAETPISLPGQGSACATSYSTVEGLRTQLGHWRRAWVRGAEQTLEPHREPTSLGRRQVGARCGRATLSQDDCQRLPSSVSCCWYVTGCPLWSCGFPSLPYHPYHCSWIEPGASDCTVCSPLTVPFTAFLSVSGDKTWQN